MVKCSKCGKKITGKTRYVIGPKGGKYHVACSSHIIGHKGYGYTR